MSPETPTRSETPKRDPAAVQARLTALKEEVTAELPKRPTAPVTPPAKPPAPKRKGRIKWVTALWYVTVAAGAIVLPFLMLIGGAVWFYRARAVPTWLALALAAALTAAVLTLYGAKVSRALTGKRRIRFVATKLALPLIVFYCAYALFYLSAVNAKTENVRAYYTTVHPLLRLALSTAILGDRELVVTDMKREPGDYARMGLSTLETSLHFVQDNGYVHAVDLRTIGRAEWKNVLLAGYFGMLGFRTLRHVGTADHLHVSIAPPGDKRL